MLTSPHFSGFTAKAQMEANICTKLSIRIFSSWCWVLLQKAFFPASKTLISYVFFCFASQTVFLRMHSGAWVTHPLLWHVANLCYWQRLLCWVPCAFLRCYIYRYPYFFIPNVSYISCFMSLARSPGQCCIRNGRNWLLLVLFMILQVILCFTIKYGVCVCV